MLWLRKLSVKDWSASSHFHLVRAVIRPKFSAGAIALKTKTGWISSKLWLSRLWQRKTMHSPSGKCKYKRQEVRERLRNPKMIRQFSDRNRGLMLAYTLLLTNLHTPMSSSCAATIVLASNHASQFVSLTLASCINQSVLTYNSGCNRGWETQKEEPLLEQIELLFVYSLWSFVQ